MKGTLNGKCGAREAEHVCGKDCGHSNQHVCAEDHDPLSGPCNHEWVDLAHGWAYADFRYMLGS